MDPISAVGIALSVAGMAGQMFTGCIQCIQFIMTAKDMPKDCIYLNLRLRLEQQRLFNWSETCGLLDHDAENNHKILESNAFGLHRSTVLELLVQMKVLFEDFQKLQIDNKRLETVGRDPLESPPSYEKSEELDSAKDSAESLVPLTPKRKKFIDKAVNAFKSTSKGGTRRLRWAAFDKANFEQLLQRFSSLNDSITALLDKRLQDEIYSATQDTNRAVLQMHHDLADLTSLVKATLAFTLDKRGPKASASRSLGDKDKMTELELLAQLARFKAFNESIETESSLDSATVDLLQLGNPGAEKVAMDIERSRINFVESEPSSPTQEGRCEAVYRYPDGRTQRVWIEWKDYDFNPGDSRPAPLIIERAQKLAALLHHHPKPRHFRVPHCLGYFDKAVHTRIDDDRSPIDDDNEYRIGFVFQKPEDVIPETPPVSLLQLLQHEEKPRLTDRIALAKSIANCILYLHSVNWLHKGLRSHNVVFFRAKNSRNIDYSKPYISGFDFARPARPGEPTEIPKDNREYNLYRHPSTQNAGLGPRESYRKSFDIYSLGVVLVELAHWAPIDQVLGIDIRASKPRPRIAAGVRKMLLQEERIKALGANMGEIYEKLVMKCITGGEELGIAEGEDETGDGAVAAKLSMVFYEEVVKKLEEIRV